MVIQMDNMNSNGHINKSSAMNSYMLEIIQSGLQLKLDMQCVREQFLSLLETYTYMEDNYLRAPSYLAPRPPPSQPVSAARARVRAMYDARRARIHARRTKFAKELAAVEASGQGTGRLTPRSHKTATVTSSEGLSDATFDEWELRSNSSGDILDSQDCSNHRHNNSPSSEGVPLTHSSPDSDIPLGGAANSGNTTSSSDGTGVITKLTQHVTMSDKENVKPEHYDDVKNNNLINSSLSDSQSHHSRGSGGSGTSKLEAITEEQQMQLNPMHIESISSSAHPNLSTSLPQVVPQSSLSNSAFTTSNLLPSNENELHSYCSNDMDIDDNGYVIMKGLDPSLMDYSLSGLQCAGEALQSRISDFSDFSHEVPRTCQSSYLQMPSSLRDTSIPIYTVRSSRDIEGEYVMLKSPFSDIGDYVTLRDTRKHCDSMMSFFEANVEPSVLLKPDTTTTLPWSTKSFNMTGNFGPRNMINNSSLMLQGLSPSRKTSPIKYATSAIITQLYTKDRSLRDISNISRISHFDQDDSHLVDTTMNSFFGSPKHQPLNSTMKGNINTVEDSDDTLENIEQHDTMLSNQLYGSRTSLNEPSEIIQVPETSRMMSPTSLDDSLLDNTPSNQLHNTMQYDSQDFVTPKRKLPKKPQLCKEHGLHPTFGGPCIFEDSFDVLDSSTEEEEEDSNHYSKSQRSSRTSSSHYATETDCDSSYLSECVDDTHFTSEFGGNEQYMYDSRHARMKMLKRQTGQTDIQHCKPAIGLSETDLHFDVTRKHLSLEATRTSMPDLTNLSLPPSECSEEHDRTLTQQSVSKTGYDKENRPLSKSTITTTTDESPESNGGIPVPVNSPNVTDSGSSRPTTDNYDYMELPDKKVIDSIRMPPPRSIPTRRRPGVGQRSPVMSSRPYDIYGSSSSSSIRTSKNIGGSLGLLPHQIKSLSEKQHHHRSHHSLRQRSSSGHRSEGLSSGEHQYSSRHDPYAKQRHYHAHSADSGNDTTVQKHRKQKHFAQEPLSNPQQMTKERKKVLAKKLKQFSNNFYNSTGNLQIKTLGHF